MYVHKYMVGVVGLLVLTLANFARMGNQEVLHLRQQIQKEEGKTFATKETLYDLVFFHPSLF